MSTFASLTELITTIPQEQLLLLLSIFLASLYFLIPRGPTKLLNAKTFTAVPLASKKKLSHDTYEYTFRLPSTNHVLGLPIGQHVVLKYTDADSGDAIVRSYTPTFGDELHNTNEAGSCKFVIKTYRPCDRFPEGGKMSQHLENLTVGDTILMRGPSGHLDYKQGGNYTTQLTPRSPVVKKQARHFAMIAGGTGLTPMLQVAKAIFREKNCGGVKVSLLYANQTPADILCRDELDAFAKQYPDNFSVHYTVDRVGTEKKWKGSVGFISEEMIRETLPGVNGGATHVLMCGPPPMIKFACLPNLAKIGFGKDAMFTF